MYIECVPLLWNAFSCHRTCPLTTTQSGILVFIHTHTHTYTYTYTYTYTHINTNIYMYVIALAGRRQRPLQHPVHGGRGHYNAWYMSFRVSLYMCFHMSLYMSFHMSLYMFVHGGRDAGFLTHVLIWRQRHWTQTLNPKPSSTYLYDGKGTEP